MRDLKKNIILDGAILINFVSLTKQEKEIIRKWRNHVDVRKWMYSDHIISPEEHAAFIKKLKKDDQNVYWLVKKTDDYLGVIYLNRLDVKKKNAYLGIYSNPAHTLPGNGKLLIEILKELVFKMLCLHSVRLEVIATNSRAVRFYEKSGFSKEGRLKEFIMKEGKWADVIIMAIISKG